VDPGLGSGSSQLALQPPNCVRPTLPWVSILHPKMCLCLWTGMILLMRSGTKNMEHIIYVLHPLLLTFAATILVCTQCIMLFTSMEMMWPTCRLRWARLYCFMPLNLSHLCVQRGLNVCYFFMA
jgi:hypothetical protein